MTSSSYIIGSIIFLFAGNSFSQASRFEYINHDSEVLDHQTGLIWRRCIEGASWVNNSCFVNPGNPIFFTHEKALAQSKTQSNWRLPNVKELGTLVDRSLSKPAINTIAFPNSPSAMFWTSSPTAGTPTTAWAIYFDSGLIGIGTRSDNGNVRLVR